MCLANDASAFGSHHSATHVPSCYREATSHRGRIPPRIHHAIYGRSVATRADCAAPTARRGLPEWSTPMRVDGVPPNRSLQWPSLALRGDTTYVVANTFPVGDDENASVRVWGLVILRFPGAPIAAPPGDFVFKYPRAAIDSEGRLHLVWGEPPDPVRAAREYTGHSPTSLWYAWYDRGRW